MRNSCVIFSFYPVVLGVSCFFMIITLVIYSRDKAIRNNYTWIVSHFVLNMLLAFIILIVNQSADIKTLNEGLCTAIGKHLTIRSNNSSVHIVKPSRNHMVKILFLHSKSNSVSFILAILQHFFFTSAFIHMTVLSVETSWRSR